MIFSCVVSFKRKKIKILDLSLPPCTPREIPHRLSQVLHIPPLVNKFGPRPTGLAPNPLQHCIKNKCHSEQDSGSMEAGPASKHQ
jgi:hypothetical protein